MGYILYTESGTFNPADYGLSVGDVIMVVAIGGGGGGAGLYYYNYITYSVQPGEAGKATSFGSLLSCHGGSAGSVSAPTDVYAGGRSGTFLQYYISANNEVSRGLYYCGGVGATGFYPGLCMPRSASTIQLLKGDQQGLAPFELLAGGGISTSYPQQAVRVAGRPYAGYAGDSGYKSGNSDNYLFVETRGAPGGFGFGAGGGSYCGRNSDNTFQDTWGGSAGEFKQLVHKLSNLSSIPVTVGAGGHGYYDNYGASSPPQYNPGYAGGAGADGCVVVFW